jgi:Protein of unknown function (DUF3168)
MNNVLTQAIFNRLNGDSTLTSMLGSYTPPGLSARAAIFSSEPVPFDAPRPYVMWAGSLSDQPFGGKLEEVTGREIHLDIKVIADATGSSQALDNITEKIYALMHKSVLTITGFTNIIAVATSGPRMLPTDPRIEGRVLTFRWVLQ